MREGGKKDVRLGGVGCDRMGMEIDWCCFPPIVLQSSYVYARREQQYRPSSHTCHVSHL